MIFLLNATSVTDAAAVNPNGIKTLLANGSSIFFINGIPVFSNGTRSPPDCAILDSQSFDNFILAVELFVKALNHVYLLIIYVENESNH